MAKRQEIPDILAQARQQVNVLDDVLSGKPLGTWPKEVEYPIDKIIIGKRMRPLSDVTSLAESIRQIGLLNAIHLLPDGTLVAGNHRIAAAKRLGWTTIRARIVEMDEVDAELAEIDENLRRSNLTVLEESEHLLRREELLEAKGQRAKHGAPQGNQNWSGGTDKGGTVPPLSTTADIAQSMGLSETSTHRRLQIARNLADDVKDAIRGNEEIANSTTQLLELARMEPTRQRTIADMLVRGEATNVVDAVRKLDPAPLAFNVVPSEATGSRQNGAELAKCRICNRPLSDPASAMNGVGPCCAAKRATAAGSGEWHEHESEPEPEPVIHELQWSASEIARKSRVLDGMTVHANMKTDLALIEWARENGLFARVDRATEWGNPFLLPADGDRLTVVENYQWYLDRKPSLLAKLPELKGKVLGCWCHPEMCHAEVLEEYADDRAD